MSSERRLGSELLRKLRQRSGRSNLQVSPEISSGLIIAIKVSQRPSMIEPRVHVLRSCRQQVSINRDGFNSFLRLTF